MKKKVVISLILFLLVLSILTSMPFVVADAQEEAIAKYTQNKASWDSAIYGGTDTNDLALTAFVNTNSQVFAREDWIFIQDWKGRAQANGAEIFRRLSEEQDTSTPSSQTPEAEEVEVGGSIFDPIKNVLKSATAKLKDAAQQLKNKANLQQTAEAEKKRAEAKTEYESKNGRWDNALYNGEQQIDQELTAFVNKYRDQYAFTGPEYNQIKEGMKGSDIYQMLSTKKSDAPAYGTSDLDLTQIQKAIAEYEAKQGIWTDVKYDSTTKFGRDMIELIETKYPKSLKSDQIEDLKGVGPINVIGKGSDVIAFLKANQKELSQGSIIPIPGPGQETNWLMQILQRFFGIKNRTPGILWTDVWSAGVSFLIVWIVGGVLSKVKSDKMIGVQVLSFLPLNIGLHIIFYFTTFNFLYWPPWWLEGIIHGVIYIIVLWLGWKIIAKFFKGIAKFIVGLPQAIKRGAIKAKGVISKEAIETKATRRKTQEAIEEHRFKKLGD